MRVRCIANTGKGFSEYTLKHRGCSEETILPFIIGDEYTVYGQLIWKGMLQYLIQGSQEHLPSWYPAEVFEVIDPRLSRSWFFQFGASKNLFLTKTLMMPSWSGKIGRFKFFLNGNYLWTPRKKIRRKTRGRLA